MTTKNQIGVIGLSVMGGNLAMNLADRNLRVAAYNRSEERTVALVTAYHGSGTIDPKTSLAGFVDSLETPRKIILMIKAGEAVDQVLGDLFPLLGKQDIVIDGGNSFFKDTIRRERLCAERGISFVGIGISGGEEGARRGPSLMPGGPIGSYIELAPYLELIAAKDFSGKPCVTHVGENGAGHYVKMVHNGIEYADMELIAETYWMMRNGLRMDNDAIADTFDAWNRGRLNSYLIEITTKILRTKTADGTAVVDTILDSAGSKGTGKWTAEESLELGLPGFALVSAVLARYASGAKSDRRKLAVAFPKNMQDSTPLPVQMLERALYAGKLLAYAEGFALLGAAEEAYGWTLDFAEISRIWQGGCIIRATLLRDIEEAFRNNESHFLLMPFVQSALTENIPALRAVTVDAMRNAVPVPTFAAALSAFDSLTSENLPANLLQAQRDFFGAHGFQTEESGAPIHWNWEA
jgi:6-phosphogluconate dehydrogenase